jgi:DMSO/TMAO reductase YedYZ molybdopterin-dependent catalytic subunit
VTTTGDEAPFYSFGQTLFAGSYYETQDHYNAMKPKCVLAFEMNGKPLPHLYGAPLRLRVENQLGYKMVKWIERLSSSRLKNWLARARAGPTRTKNTSICCRTSDSRPVASHIQTRTY